MSENTLNRLDVYLENLNRFIRHLLDLERWLKFIISSFKDEECIFDSIDEIEKRFNKKGFLEEESMKHILEYEFGINILTQYAK